MLCFHAWKEQFIPTYFFSSSRESTKNIHGRTKKTTFWYSQDFFVRSISCWVLRTKKCDMLNISKLSKINISWYSYFVLILSSKFLVQKRIARFCQEGRNIFFVEQIKNEVFNYLSTSFNTDQFKKLVFLKISRRNNYLF